MVLIDIVQESSAYIHTKRIPTPVSPCGRIETCMSANDDTPVEQTNNWPELVAMVYEEMSGGDGSTTLRLRNMEIQVPSKTGPDADHAHWTVDGTIDLNPEE
jgi:hypothetical protein